MCFTHHQRVDAIKVSRSNDIILSVYRLNLVMYTTLVLLTLRSQFCSLLSQLVPTTTFNQHKKSGINCEITTDCCMIPYLSLSGGIRTHDSYIRTTIAFTTNNGGGFQPLRPLRNMCLFIVLVVVCGLEHTLTILKSCKVTYLHCSYLIYYHYQHLRLEKCIICKFQLRFLLSALYTLSYRGCVFNSR